MRAGKLRHQVTFQQVTTSRDDFGASIEAWADFAAVWAEVVDLTGRELLAAQQIQAEITTRVTVRYRGDLKPTMRVLHGNRILQVEAILDTTGRQDELQVLCREVVT